MFIMEYFLEEIRYDLECHIKTNKMAMVILVNILSFLM